MSGSIDEDDQMTSSMLEEAEAEDEEAQLEEDSTRVVAHLHPVEDQAAEAITGMKGLAREESDDKKV